MVPCQSQHQREFKYVHTCLDDASGMSIVSLLKSKSEAPAIVELVIQLWESQSGKTVKRVRTDNGGEFINHELGSYYSSKGIQQEPTQAYSPESNGKAERLGRTLLERAQLMLGAAGMEQKYWGAAFPLRGLHSQ